MRKKLFLFVVIFGSLLLVGCEEEVFTEHEEVEQLREEELVAIEFERVKNTLGTRHMIYVETNEGAYAESSGYVDFIKSGENQTKITYGEDRSRFGVMTLTVYVGENDWLEYSKAYAKEFNETLVFKGE